MKTVDNRISLVPALLGLFWLATAAGGQEPGVTITGGLQADGSHYRWEITNRSLSPVVSIEFPHYQADQFTPPDRPGWKSKSTYLVNVGVEDRPGTCRAFVDSPIDGIPRGGKVSVGMRVRLLESRQGRGTVIVQLADGTRLEIANVEVPVVPGYFERFGVLITLAIIIGLVAVIATLRRRRHGPQISLSGTTQSAESSSPPPADDP